MPTSGLQLWTRRQLYRVILAVALVLALLVSIAPYVPLPTTTSLVGKLWRCFAADVTLRQVSVVSALGLWITALVFFRAPAKCPGSSVLNPD